MTENGQTSDSGAASLSPAKLLPRAPREAPGAAAARLLGKGADAIASAYDDAIGDPAADPAAEWDGGPPDDPDDPGPRAAGDGGGGKKPQGSKPPGAVAMARAYAARVPILSDDYNGLYAFTGTHWRALSKFGALKLAAEAGAEGASSVREEIVKWWQAMCHREGRIWGRVPEHEIPLQNGVLNLDDGTMRRHRADDFLERVVPHDYVAGAECVAWSEMLEMWFGSLTDGRVVALQEFAGYCLTSHAMYKRALMLYGVSNSGKSVALKVLKMLVGAEHTSAIPLDALDDPKLAAEIKGKALNAVGELPDGALVKDGAFKTIVSTEEDILLDGKWKAVESYTPTAKIAIATNTLPTITDKSKATFNRLLVLYFERDLVAEGIDKDPAEVNAELEACMPGIVAWAVEGARRLYRNHGKFTDPPSSTGLIQSYRDEQNPLLQFLDERCQVVASHDGKRQRGTPITHLVRAFNRWHEGGHSWTAKRMTSTLKTMAIDGVEVKKVKWNSATLSTAVGIELRAAAEVPRVMDLGDGENGEAVGWDAVDAPADERPIDAPPPDDEEPL